MPGIGIDLREVATKVSKYKTDSYKEYFHEILLKDYTGELQIYTDGSKNEEGRVGCLSQSSRNTHMASQTLGQQFSLSGRALRNT